MKRRVSQDARVIIVLLFLALVVGLISSGRESGSGGQEVMPKRTTYLSGPSGLKALYVTLDKLGYRMERHLQPLTTEPDDGVLFIVSPELSIADVEWQSTRRWVERGNLLVVATGHDEFPDEDPRKTKRSTPDCPSFLCAGVKSFRASDVDRIREDHWSFEDDALCAKPDG